MSLNKLKIPGIMLAGMYKNELVVLREHIATGGDVAGTAPEEIKEVLIVLEEPVSGPVSEQSTAIVSKILAACKWPLHNTTLLNITGAPVTWNQLKLEGIPRICILFGPGAQALDLPVVFPEFRIHPLGDTKFLQCPSPQQVEQDKLLKSKLWLCMKELFNV